MAKALKEIFFLYQRSMYYVSQAYGEYSKAGRFLNESLLLSIFLKSLNVKITILDVALFNIAMLVLATLIGKFLTIIGVTSYNTRLGNKYNPEMLEILERLKNIEEKLNDPTRNKKETDQH